ncbi:MAG: kelch repeat-containing protein [Candidatus Cloacimonadales bacterium]|nr:kelch repeat-containing protein [Candidatus Cloacimonadales bacterium]
MKKILILTIFLFLHSQFPVLMADEWILTGNMNTTRRISHTSVLLNNNVLVTGGYGPYPQILSSCEIYNPETGQWTYTGEMNKSRNSHQSVLLQYY